MSEDVVVRAAREGDAESIGRIHGEGIAEPPTSSQTRPRHAPEARTER